MGRTATIGVGGLLATMLCCCSLLVDSDGLSAGNAVEDATQPRVTDPTFDAGFDADADSIPRGRFGHPLVIARGLSQPSRLVADESTLYWIGGDSAVHRRPTTVEGTSSVFAQSTMMRRALAVNASSVFFVAGHVQGWTYVFAAPKAGGTAVQMFGHSGGSDAIPAISIEGSGIALLWKEGTTRRIKRGNVDGTGAFDVATGQSGVSAVMLRAPHVYWSAPTGILRSNGQAPSAPEVFASEASGVTELAADDTTLYWIPADGKLRALRFDQPGADPVILTTNLKSPRAIAVDSEYVYWGSATTGEVAAVPKAGGTPIVLATGQADPYAIVALDTAVFFTNYSAGTLVRVPKQ